MEMARIGEWQMVVVVEKQRSSLMSELHTQSLAQSSDPSTATCRALHCDELCRQPATDDDVRAKTE
jgi:hypothetical protein